MPTLNGHSHLFGLQEAEGNEADSESDECILSFWGSIAWLAILTVFISILSEYLVDAIEVRGQTDPGWNVRLVLFQ
jgi:Ca2+:H+ antiporter